MESVKRFFYGLFVDSWLAGFINKPLVSIVIPVVVGLYYIVLDVWGDEWSIVVNYKLAHEVVFSFLAGSTVVVAFWKGVSESFRSKTEAKSLDMQKAIANYCSDLVSHKSQAVYKRAKQLKPNGSPFRRVILPREQIERSIGGVHKLLSDTFDIDKRSIRITIISRNPNGGKWFYEFKNKDQREHHPANEIMSGSSAASHCLRTGEPLFVADIRKGEKENVFVHSFSSKSSKVGSLYCKPVKIVVNGSRFDYIFTVAVYGELLCQPYKDDECEAWVNILDDIADRIELELYLLSVDKFSSGGVR